MTEQLSILDSLERGHAAADLAADKADRLDEGWSERALEWLRVYAAMKDAIDQARWKESGND